MPQSDRRGISTGTLIWLAAAAWLAGCVPIEDGKTEAAAGPDAAITAEALSGPVPLAPELKAPQPATRSADVTADKIAAVLAAPAPAPAPASEAAAEPVAAAAAAAPPAPPPVTCPPGTAGKWSGPDVIGQPVYICRRLNPS
jgi:hypothetical protein